MLELPSSSSDENLRHPRPSTFQEYPPEHQPWTLDAELYSRHLKAEEAYNFEGFYSQTETSPIKSEESEEGIGNPYAATQMTRQGEGQTNFVKIGNLILPPETKVPQTFYDYSKPLASTSKAAAIPVPAATSSSLGPIRSPPSTSSGSREQPKLRASVSKSLEKAHTCDICKSSFNRHHDLKRHKILHQEVKPFQCPVCEKEFARKEAIKRHFNVKICGRKVTREQEKAALEGNHHLKYATAPQSPASSKASLKSPVLSASGQSDDFGSPSSPRSFCSAEEDQLLRSPTTFSSMLSPITKQDPFAPSGRVWPERSSSQTDSVTSLGSNQPFTPTPPLISPGSTDSCDSLSIPMLSTSQNQQQQQMQKGYLLPPVSSYVNAMSHTFVNYSTSEWLVSPDTSGEDLLGASTNSAMSYQTDFQMSVGSTIGSSSALGLSTTANFSKMLLPSPEDWPTSPDQHPPSDYFSSRAPTSKSSTQTLRYIARQQWD